MSNRTSDKITPLADNVFLCRSGSAADTQAVSDFGARVARAWRRLCAVSAGAERASLSLRVSPPLRAVRHFVHQHVMEIGGPPDVHTVAMLAQSVRGAARAPRRSDAAAEQP